MTSDLLSESTKFCALKPKHLVVMMPPSRMHCEQSGNVPYDLNAECYGQWSSDGGLLIGEAPDINPRSNGYR